MVCVLNKVSERTGKELGSVPPKQACVQFSVDSVHYQEKGALM